MRILIVKLSSLGDVIHTLPAIVDIKKNHPQAQIDWVVEPAFASLLEGNANIDRVIVCALRMWLKNRLDASSRRMARSFLRELRQTPYDLVIDLQGLSKSALIARCAVLSPSGQRVAMANRTEGSSYEPLTRWLANRSYELPQRVGAVERARLLCAMALGYEVPQTLDFGMNTHQAHGSEHAFPSGEQMVKASPPQVLLIHGTSRADKSWPMSHWVALSSRLLDAGMDVCVTYASESELDFVKALMQEVEGLTLWPQQSLGALSKKMQGLTGAIGVDSGVSHLAVALDLVHVQIYNFPTHWRTGPFHNPHQVSVFETPTPTVEQVWAHWLQVLEKRQTLP